MLVAAMKVFPVTNPQDSKRIKSDPTVQMLFPSLVPERKAEQPNAAACPAQTALKMHKLFHILFARIRLVDSFSIYPFTTAA